MVRGLVVLSLSLAGCGGAEVGPPSVDAGAADLAAAPDLAPSRIVAGPTDGTVRIESSDVSLMGAGHGSLGAIGLTDGSGTVEIDGRSVPAAVYLRQPWLSMGYVLYQALAVERDRIHVLWFYCKGDALDGVYREATDGTELTWEAAAGTCADSLSTSTVRVRFPAVDLPLPPLVDGYYLHGSDVSLDGATPGTVRLGGTPLTVLVFGTVDCTAGCGTPGWTELHSLLWDPAAARFGIFYLHEDDHTRVQLTYSLTLPVLTDPAGNLMLQARWSGP